MKNLSLILLTSFLILPSLTIASTSKGFLGIRGSLNWGLGKMSDENKTIKERTMNTLEINAIPGINVGDLLIGAFLAYRMVGQNTEPSEVENQNLKGSGYLAGVGTSYTMGNFSLMAALSFLGNHKQSVKDISGSEITFQKPFGVHIGADYLISNGLGAGLTFSSVKYKEDKVGDNTSDVSSNKRSHWNIGLGITIFI